LLLSLLPLLPADVVVALSVVVAGRESWLL